LTSTSKGVFFTLGAYTSLIGTPGWLTTTPAGLNRNLFQIAIAPDNAQFIAVTSDNGTLGTGPREVWITQNGGALWEITNLNTFLSTPMWSVNETVRCFDISVDYGGKRDIAVGTSTGTGNGRLIVAKSTGFAGWRQNWAGADWLAMKFSPSYASDGALATVHAFNPAWVPTGTYYQIFLRDLSTNTVNQMVFNPVATFGIEVTGGGAGSSPNCTQINKADIELPSDFSGQAASLRRAYISTDCYNGGAAKLAWDGIVRIDNGTVYVL